MSLPTATVDRNAEVRRTLARMTVYALVGRIGGSPSRAYATHYLAWRLGDIPVEPVAADVDLPADLAAGWRGTVDGWLAEAMRDA